MLGDWYVRYQGAGLWHKRLTVWHEQMDNVSCCNLSLLQRWQLGDWAMEMKPLISCSSRQVLAPLAQRSEHHLERWTLAVASLCAWMKEVFPSTGGLSHHRQPQLLTITHRAHFGGAMEQSAPTDLRDRFLESAADAKDSAPEEDGSLFHKLEIRGDESAVCSCIASPLEGPVTCLDFCVPTPGAPRWKMSFVAGHPVA